jgi:hypothetical protein
VLKHPVPEALLARIGDVTVSFALLESVMQTLAASQIQDHQRIGQIITAELSLRSLRALTLSLYRERYGEDSDYEELRALIKRARELEDIRNAITHSVWAAGRQADTVTRIKLTAREKQGLHFDFESVTVENLGKVAEEMRQLAEDVQRFWIRLVEAGKAYQGTGNTPST